MSIGVMKPNELNEDLHDSNTLGCGGNWNT
jgi:hypothetical protein